MDFFNLVAKDLDNQCAELIKNISRKNLSPISQAEESQLLKLVETLQNITTTCRDSLIWRCGLVTVCGEDPVSCGVDNNNDGVIGGVNSNNNSRSSSRTPYVQGGMSKTNTNVTGGSSSSVQMTPLDSRVSVISRLTDILSLIFVAHNHFLGSEHEIVMEKSQTVTLLTVLAGACDVPFLSQPVCATVLDSLLAIFQDFLGIVHAEHCCLNSNSSSNTNNIPNSSAPASSTSAARRFPLIFTVHSYRYMLRSLSRRIFQPLYATWLISALGSPENLTPFPGMMNNSSSSAGNSNNNLSFDAIQNQDAASNVHDSQNQSVSSSSPSPASSHHSCFLKDAVVRIICGGFLGDGPSASPHAYIATAMNILAMILLTPVEQQQSSSQNQNSAAATSSSTSTSESHHHNKSFDRRAPQIFGNRSVEGMSTILEALMRRTVTPRGKNRMKQQQQQQQNKSGNNQASSILDNMDTKQVKKLLKLFWNVRPLVQSLTNCPLTRTSFLSSDSTRSMFDFTWKVLAGLVDILEDPSRAVLEPQDDYSSNTTSTTAGTSSTIYNATSKNQQHQLPTATSIAALCVTVLPVAVSLWKGVSTQGAANREFCDTIFHFARKVSSILVPPPSTRIPLMSSSSSPQNNNNNANNNSSYYHHHMSMNQHPVPPHELVLAFDCLVDAVEFAASIEFTSPLNDWLSQASSEGLTLMTKCWAEDYSQRTFAVQSAWPLMLLTLGLEDRIVRCAFASILGKDSNNNQQQLSESSIIKPIPPHLEFELPAMTVVVDTILRDAVLTSTTTGSSTTPPGTATTPDTILGALSACGGSPFALNVPLFMPNAILRRGLLQFASIAAISSSSSSSPGPNNSSSMLVSSDSVNPGTTTNITTTTTSISIQDVCRVLLRQQPDPAFSEIPSGGSVSLAWTPTVLLPSASASASQQQQQQAIKQQQGNNKLPLGSVFPGVNSSSSSISKNNDASSPTRQQQQQQQQQQHGGIPLNEYQILHQQQQQLMQMMQTLMISRQSSNNNNNTSRSSSNNSNNYQNLDDIPPPQSFHFDPSSNNNSSNFNQMQQHMMTMLRNIQHSMTQQQNNQNQNNNVNIINNDAKYAAIISSHEVKLSHQEKIIEDQSQLISSLRNDLSDQKAQNTDMLRELQKRSGETNVFDAKVRALHDTISSLESECQQHKVAHESARQLLEEERQQKQQMFVNETSLRNELSMTVGKLRDAEMRTYEIQAQSQARIEEAEKQSAVFSAQLHKAQQDIEIARINLVQSEERVGKFLSLHATFADMSRKV